MLYFLILSLLLIPSCDIHAASCLAESGKTYTVTINNTKHCSPFPDKHRVKILLPNQKLFVDGKTVIHPNDKILSLNMSGIATQNGTPVVKPLNDKQAVPALFYSDLSGWFVVKEDPNQKESNGVNPVLVWENYNNLTSKEQQKIQSLFS